MTIFVKAAVVTAVKVVTDVIEVTVMTLVTEYIVYQSKDYNQLVYCPMNAD